MGLTKAAVYGIYGLVYLAKQPKDKVVSLSEVASMFNLPKKFLAKIFQMLAKVGFVTSYRGIRGGFRLNRLKDEITLKEIIECIQGPIHFLFLENRFARPNAVAYKLKEICQEIEGFCHNKLESVTLIDLV